MRVPLLSPDWEAIVPSRLAERWCPLCPRDLTLLYPDDRGPRGVHVTRLCLVCGWQTWGKAAWHLRGLHSGDDTEPRGP